MIREMKCWALALGAVMLTACNSDKDLYDPAKAAELKEAQYAAGFVKKYGQIAANQDWGFGPSTRAANTNSNQWKDYVIVPEGITADEQAAVEERFKNRLSASVSVDWTDFFVQHVSRAAGRGNMDKLVAANDDHINNFNAQSGSIMLMQNSSTSQFGYQNSLDSKMHYNYSIQEINGSYYVGFDFEANGQNPNQQEAADGIYNDWIVKICPAVYKNTKRIIAEDLGSIGDFDFNDVVFDVAILSDATVITLQAAGGTLPLYIQVGSEQREVHEAFGVSLATMVNTGLSSQKNPVMFRLPACNDVGEVNVVINNQNATNTLKAEIGKAPQKICVEVSYEWTNECQSIEDKYPGFLDYVGNPSLKSSWY